MGLIICHCCGRQRMRDKAQGKAFECTNCGARDVRVVSRNTRLKLRLDDNSDRDGEELHAARRQIYAGLRYMQELKGYKREYIGAMFMEMFGSWPNGETGTPAAQPSPLLRHWIKRRNNAFKKRMRAQEAAALKPVAPETASSLMTEEDFNVSWR